jgi:hypothetical protein
LRAIVVLRALGFATGAIVANRASAAFTVCLAGSTAVARTHLAGGALCIVLAKTGDGAALAVAAFATFAAVVAVSAHLALAGDAKLFGLAILVGFASGILWLACRHGHEQQSHKKS